MLTINDVLGRITQEAIRYKKDENLDNVRFTIYVDPQSFSDLKQNCMNMTPEAVMAFGIMEEGNIIRLAGHRLYVVKTTGFHLNICKSN